ncbi:MAG: AcrR family transcriptional regulator [Candidatus Nanohaloarchaea archaeon]|jgi:AcrR family transcriptional regulator
MEESKKEIMEATFRALSEHGYAELSIQKIADESDKAKSAIYYHYEDKEDLLLAFLEFLEESIDEMHAEIEEKPPEERLDELLDLGLGVRDDERWMVQRALLDLRAQAPRNEKFARKFEEIDQMVRSNVVDIMEEMDIENPELTAEIFVSCIEGAVNRKVSAGDREGLEELRHGIKRMLDKKASGSGCGCCNNDE